MALALISSGVDIQRILPFDKSSGRERLIQVGMSQQALFEEPNSVDRVQRLSLIVVIR